VSYTPNYTKYKLPIRLNRDTITWDAVTWDGTRLPGALIALLRAAKEIRLDV